MMQRSVSIGGMDMSHFCSIPDYYGVGRPGVRLEKRLPEMI